MENSFFTEAFIASLKHDPISGAREICNKVSFEITKSEANIGWTVEEYKILLEASIILEELISSNALPDVDVSFSVDQMPFDRPKACQEMKEFIDRVDLYCESQHNRMETEKLRMRTKLALGKIFSYEFSKGDLDRVQDLLNQLREQISTSKKLDDEHRQRILKRLEALQKELHKKVSDLDKFYGVVADVGVVIRKLGEDAKPIVDRLREVVSIVWQTQSRAEELPSGTTPPLLGQEDNTST